MQIAVRAVLLGALALAGCNKSAGAPQMFRNGPESAAAATAGFEDVAPHPLDAAAAPASAPLLAYSYTYRIQAPAAAVPALLKKHEKACVDAGPTTCQVTAASTSAIGRDSLQGSLTLRAEPRWLTVYRDRLEGDAKGVGGRLAGTNTSTEDLTRNIVDTDAALRAKKLLRDRLEGLLASRSGKLEELVGLEKSLAEVQGEIDTAQSELGVMRTRVATSELQVNYESDAAMAPDSAFRPIGRAAHDFLGNAMSVVGFLITLLSILLPLALIAVPAVWLGRKLWRRRKALRAAASPPPAD